MMEASQAAKSLVRSKWPNCTIEDASPKTQESPKNSSTTRRQQTLSIILTRFVVTQSQPENPPVRTPVNILQAFPF